MVSPAGESVNAQVALSKDFLISRNHPKVQDSHSAPGKAALVEKTREQQLYDGGTTLTESLRKEFNQIFQLGADRVNPFLGELDRIAEGVGL